MVAVLLRDAAGEERRQQVVLLDAVVEAVEEAAQRVAPACVPAASTRPAAAGVASAVILRKSPWLQMNFWISLSAVTSMVVSMPRCCALGAPLTTGCTRGSRFFSVVG